LAESESKASERVPNKKFKMTFKGKPIDVAVFESPGDGPYKIKLEIGIGDQLYPVEVETEAPLEVIKPVAAQAPAQVGTPAPSAKPEQPKVVSKANQLTAPLPGKILNISVEVGDYVNAGESIIILEAMKMENEIRAPVKGKIAKIYRKVGDSVATGDPLVDFQ